MAPLSVAITGFTPFGHPRPKNNPSWSAVCAFKEALEAKNAKIKLEARQVEIQWAQELPVEYEAIDSILMPPGGDFPMDVDLVLHVGQGKKGMVCVEQYARSMPYTQLDNKDQVPQKGDGRRWGWPKDWETLKTHVPVYELVEFLSHDQKWPEVYPSKDAGLYLCEYTYYTSLAKARMMREGEKEEDQGPLVLFIHVPADDDYYTTERTGDLLEAVCRWIHKAKCTQKVSSEDN
ncbi:MAG: hypothetical protein DHS80DRAFT_24079 [Piptocephalis tieghemiana]|nr:MAG: hypothetical protein DHS80DRAFT_24079 [Piptocephalis tieghemiana]